MKTEVYNNGYSPKREVYYTGYEPKCVKDRCAYYVDRSNSEIMQKILKAYIRCLNSRGLNLDMVEERRCYRYHLEHKEAFLMFFDHRSGAVYHAADGNYRDTYTVIKMTNSQPLMTIE